MTYLHAQERGVTGSQAYFARVLGGCAGELMAVVQLAMIGKMPCTALRDAIFTHPTMAEGLGVLFGAVPARSRAGAG